MTTTWCTCTRIWHRINSLTCCVQFLCTQMTRGPAYLLVHRALTAGCTFSRKSQCPCSVCSGWDFSCSFSIITMHRGLWCWKKMTLGHRVPCHEGHLCVSDICLFLQSGHLCPVESYKKSQEHMNAWQKHEERRFCFWLLQEPSADADAIIAFKAALSNPALQGNPASFVQSIYFGFGVMKHSRSIAICSVRGICSKNTHNLGVCSSIDRSIDLQINSSPFFC